MHSLNLPLRDIDMGITCALIGVCGNELILVLDDSSMPEQFYVPVTL